MHASSKLTVCFPPFSAQNLIFPRVLLDIFHVDGMKSLKQSLAAILGLQPSLGVVEKFGTNIYFRGIIFIVEKSWIVLTVRKIFVWLVLHNIYETNNQQREHS